MVKEIEEGEEWRGRDSDILRERMFIIRLIHGKEYLIRIRR
jgi:hypothetical protein